MRLLPDRDGHLPGVVLSARDPAKLTVTAAQVQMNERQYYGSNYIGMADSEGQITPRRLATALNIPAAVTAASPTISTTSASTSFSSPIIHKYQIG